LYVPEILHILKMEPILRLLNLQEVFKKSFFFTVLAFLDIAEQSSCIQVAHKRICLQNEGVGAIDDMMMS
jgi:hypothetical protein